MKRRDAPLHVKLDGYAAFCESADAPAFPADERVFSAYLRTFRGRTRDTIQKQRLTVQNAHRNAGLPPPLVEPDVAEMERLAPERAAAHPPAGRREAHAMVAALDPRTPNDARDAVLCLLRFAYGYRMSEISRLRIEDIETTDDVVKLGAEVLDDGTDSATLSRWVRTWLAHLGRTSGPLIVGWHVKGYWIAGAMSEKKYSTRVRRAAALAGIIPAATGGPKLFSVAVRGGRRA